LLQTLGIRESRWTAWNQLGTSFSPLAALALVARTASHLCTIACMVEGLRGWGRGLQPAVADWDLNKPVN
jgi:hypothetical protein